MARRKSKGRRIAVFKGREAELNRAIFHILALKSPLTIYDIYKEVKAQRGLRHTRYATVNKRVKALDETGYVKRVGERKTKAGFKATVYELTVRAYLGIVLNSISLEDLITKADEATATIILTAITGNL